MEITQIITFAVVASLLVVSPGPNGVLIAKTVPISGKSAGFANIAGFVAAFYLHGALSILGISVILVNSSQAFFVVKILGAAYLCWIGVNALLAAWNGNKTVKTTCSTAECTSIGKAFFEGFLTNALNPKVSMFYLAAFPQFIPVGGDASSAFFLVFLHSFINILWFTAMVLLLSRLTYAAKSGFIQRWLKAITGFVFVTFGIKLASLEP